MKLAIVKYFCVLLDNCLSTTQVVSKLQMSIHSLKGERGKQRQREEEERGREGRKERGERDREGGKERRERKRDRERRRKRGREGKEGERGERDRGLSEESFTEIHAKFITH